MVRKFYSMTFLLSGLLFISACSDNIDKNININETTDISSEAYGVSYNTVVDGVEFKIEFDKDKYVIGDDIEISVTAKNISGSNLSVWSDFGTYGKNGAIGVCTYIDDELDYIYNSRGFEDIDNEYEGVLENRESISSSITFYTDTIIGLTAEDYLDMYVYLGVFSESGERSEIGTIVPVNIAFD